MLEVSIKILEKLVSVYFHLSKTLWGEVYFYAALHLIVKLENSVKIPEFPIEEKIILKYMLEFVSE